jgi:hypothetical protein
MRRILLAAALAASLVAVAQPGPPPGRGPGYGCGAGGGPGAGPGGGPCFNAQTVPGWAMMTPEERAQHQQRMRSMHGYDECVAYMNQHHGDMQARAKAQGKKLPWNGPGPGCDYLKKDQPKP